ncbi:hypothetical protein [Azohydromonas sediminis]|uniref:hypothetical protein n=1 Tax=Azohydromonas sediminis TaxID=2259674 RepID=UPI0013C2D263|nr:hypothetical protein [Azohydromonas sediminis]
MPRLQIKRGQSYEIQSAADDNLVLPGELFLATDQERLFYATATDSVQRVPKFGEANFDHVGNFAWPVRQSSPRIIGDGASTALTTLALTASRQYFIPFSLPRTLLLEALRISVTTASAGSASVGVYANTNISGDDAPGELLASASGLNVGTTGNKDGALTLPDLCRPGSIYWASIICSSAATVRALAIASVQPSLGRVSNSNSAVTYLYAAGSGSTMPNTAPDVLTNGTGSCPAIYMLVQAPGDG